MTRDQPGTTAHCTRHGRSHIRIMVVRCKPPTKDHLPLKTAFSGLKGWWSLVTGFTVLLLMNDPELICLIICGRLSPCVYGCLQRSIKYRRRRLRPTSCAPFWNGCSSKSVRTVHAHHPRRVYVISILFILIFT